MIMALSVLWLAVLIGLAISLNLRGYTFTHHPDLTQRAAVQKVVSPPFFCALQLFFYIEKGKSINIRPWLTIPTHKVSWDERSLFINGERVVLFSGEIHPFR
jgi:hypothetical protein